MMNLFSIGISISWRKEFNIFSFQPYKSKKNWIKKKVKKKMMKTKKLLRKQKSKKRN
jgi:hypothetical protein